VNREDGASASAPTGNREGQQDAIVLREFTLADYAGVLSLWQQAGPGIEIRPSDSRDQVAKKLARDRDLFLVAEIADDAGIKPDAARVRPPSSASLWAPGTVAAVGFIISRWPRAIVAEALPQRWSSK
jgi:hypothetical protein